MAFFLHCLLVLKLYRNRLLSIILLLKRTTADCRTVLVGVGCDEQIAFFFEDLTKCNLNMQVQKAYRVNSCMALGTASFRKLSVLERMLVEDVFDKSAA